MDESIHISSEEKALDVMQHSKDIASENLDELMRDEEAMQMCADIACVSVGMQMDKNLLQIDAAQELARFKAKRRSGLRLWKSIGVGAVAAAIVGVVFFIANLSSFSSKKPVVVYKADSVRPHIMIQASDKSKPELLSEVIARQSDDMGVQYTADSINYMASAVDASSESAVPVTYTLSIPKGETFRLVLSDGSEVYLNADSRLVYPKVFKKAERVVTLEGEGYFKIAHNSEKPFIVKCGALQVRVLGTEFNIHGYQSSRPVVTLVNGKVALDDTEGNHLADLTPGQNATLDADGKIRKENVDIESFLYWKEGYFYFDDVTLSDMMREIGEWYNINVVFESTDIMNLRMHFFADRNKEIGDIVDQLNKMECVYAYIENDCLFIK